LPEDDDHLFQDKEFKLLKKKKMEKEIELIEEQIKLVRAQTSYYERLSQGGAASQGPIL
jgi:hypothetical protein